MAELVEYEWNAEPGYFYLSDGRRVWVQHGDVLLGYEDPNGGLHVVDFLTRQTFPEN